MKTVNIKLSSIDDIRVLVDCATECKYDVELSCGSYTIDAKSIMGIFGLDLAKPISLTVYGNDCEEFLEKIKPFTLTTA